MVRAQDVRATEKDRVKIADCFRGGDVVRGLVVSTALSGSNEPFSNVAFQLSLGDARSYYVTTARNDLGVIFASSEAGECGCLPNISPLLILSARRFNNGTSILARNALP